MDALVSLLNDKKLKPPKTEALCNMVVEATISVNDLLKFAATQKDSIKATCIESIEYATNLIPSIATKECLQFVKVKHKEVFRKFIKLH